MTHKPDDMPEKLEEAKWKGEPCANPHKGWIVSRGKRITRLGNRNAFGKLIELHNREIELLEHAINARADRVPIEPGEALKALDYLIEIMPQYGEGTKGDRYIKTIRDAIQSPAPSDPLVDVLGEALKNVRGLISYLGEGEPNDQYDEMLGPKLPEMLRNVDAALAQYNARRGG